MLYINPVTVRQGVAAMGEAVQDCCSICLEAEGNLIDVHEDVKHAFHRHCLHNWFDTQGTFTCPLCRRLVSIEGIRAGLVSPLAVLMFAAKNGILEYAKYSIEFCLHEKDVVEGVVLDIASRNGHYETYNFLVNRTPELFNRVGCCQILTPSDKLIRTLTTTQTNFAFFLAVVNSHFSMALALWEEVKCLGDAGFLISCIVATGRIAALRILLDLGCDLTGDSYGCNGEPLLAAIDSGKVEMVQLVLEHGSSPNNILDEAPINKAIISNEIEMLELLLKTGSEIHISCLILAAAENRCEALSLLVASYESKHGSPVPDKVFMAAIKNQAMDVIEAYLTEFSERPSLITPLMILLISKDKVWILRRFLDFGANPDEGDALLLAIEQGRNEIVKLLLQAGANVHLLNDQALALSVELRNLIVVQELLKCGADMSAQDCSPFSQAVEKRYWDIVKAFIEAGFDLSFNGNMAFHEALHSNNIEMTLFLLGKGADPQSRNNSALIYTASKGQLDMMVRLLDEFKVPVGAQENLALIKASGAGHLACVQELIKRGADVRAQGDTPIEQAALNGRLAVVQLLFELGARLPEHAKNEVLTRQGLISVRRFLFPQPPPPPPRVLKDKDPACGCCTIQ